MSTLHPVVDGGSSPKGAVIFVHGLNGDPFGTWQAGKNKNNFWPKWLAADLPDMAISTLEYDADVSNWFGSSMALPDRAANVLAEIEVSIPEQLPVVFICHSLGGLVIKHALRTSVDKAGNTGGALEDRTRGIVFLATPNQGADLASWADKFRVLLRPSDSVEDMQSHGPYLLDLNSWYRDNAQRFEIETLAFIETQKTKGITVVDASSGNPGIPGVRPIPLDANHMGICKPIDKNATVYKQVRRFVEQALLTAPASSSPSRQPDIPNKTYDIFISHSSAQKPWVEALARNLLNAGRSVFLDTWCLVPGKNWIEGLKDGLDASRAAILVVSPESHHSGWVREEYEALSRRRADNPDLPIIPVIHSTVDGDLPFAESIQWVDFRDHDSYSISFAKLLSGLDGTPPGPSPDYAGPLEIPDPERRDDLGDAANSMIDEAFETLFNASAILILAQDGSAVSGLAREIRLRAEQRYGPDDVGVIVPSYVPAEDGIAAYFRDLAKQIGLEDEITGANDFRQQLDGVIDQRASYCLIITGIEHCHPEMLDVFAGILRAVDNKHEQFRVVICGGEKLCNLKYANGAHSYLSHAQDLRWPEPGVQEIHAEAKAIGIDGLSDDTVRLIFDCSGGHLGVARELCQLAGAGEFDPENCAYEIENSSSIWSAMTPLMADTETRATIRALVDKEDLGMARPFIPNLVLRRLYWLNLVKSCKVSNRDRLVWRSEQIRGAVQTILSEQ